MCAKRLERRANVVALLVVLWAVVLLAVDLLLGWTTISAEPTGYRCRHPYYHHGFLANVESETRWGDRRYRIATNSLGLRDVATRSVAMEPKDHRVVVIGDSFSEGLGVEYEASFCGLLAEDLGGGVELLNAAAVSYSPKLYYLKIEYLLEQGLEMDELLVMIDVSDIQDETFYESFEPRKTFSLRSKLDGLLFRRSFIYHHMSTWFDPGRRISNRFEMENTADFDVWLHSEHLPEQFDQDERFDWTIDGSALDDWAQHGLELATDNMNRLVELCQEEGIDVRVAVYPSPYQIFNTDLDSIHVRHWRRFCQRRGLAFIDLFPVFINESFRGPEEVYDRFFIEQDVHWNEDGHRLVADALNSFLEP